MIFRRILGLIPMILGISLISFWLMHLAPGDPTSMMIDPKISVADRALLLANLGLNQPWWVQYGHWLKEVLHGNLGFSYVSGQPVASLIFQRLGPTLLLSITSLFFTFLLSIPIGLWSGFRNGKKFDQITSVSSLIGLSMPPFWLGLILILIFSLQLNILPTSGMIDPETNATGLAFALQVAVHLILPTATLVLGSLAGLIRFQRFNTLKELSSGYVQAARARGFSWARVLFVHVVKNTLLPLITILGFELPGLVSGAFVIEYIFAWPGMGQLGVSAVFSRDYPVIMGLLLMTSILMLVGNLLADLAYRLADPRIRS